ncbi:MAG: 2-succinyl-6-hydroxy-2,4-cyclohexadiene-1-carboxylate synthase [Chlamydiae bacterium]|nr:2-succinyl-6-hydroxy-2,4-cyclohexadiene-1-carboxylate synthase [Chlamydiota bacterium]
MATFLHGFLGSPEDWKPLNIDGTFLTLPGHQGRPLDLSLLEREIPEETTLIGYSLGGRLAMHFASRFPERIKRLIILSADPGLEEGRAERMVRDEKWARLLENEGTERFLESWYKQPLFSSLDPTELIGREDHDPKTLAKILRELSPAKLPSMWERLEEFSFPMLFLFGESDIKYQPIAERLSEKFRVDFIPNAGHAIHIEEPALCAEKILGEIDEYHK